MKNEAERLVVLNRVARSVIDSQRAADAAHVFVYAPKPRKAQDGEASVELTPRPLTSMNNTAWKNARVRAAGVSFEDRQDLLGHKSGRITTHYSGAELANMIVAAEKVCEENSRKSSTITVLRRRAG